ncbi:MAG TPA: glycerol-3-phosphate acyltransferase [Acidimicrobiia bacterium]
MRDVLLTVLAAMVGYLLGTIPSAGVVAWLATRGRINLREAGSGNPGAINAIKMLGTRWGVVVLVADIAKGAAAGLLGLLIAGDPGAYAAATAAIAGHIFPVWSGFRGGKGVATSAGACLAAFPAYFPIDMIVAGASALKSRRSELGTQVACVVWVVSALVWWLADLPNLWGPDPSVGLFLFSVIGSTMILYKFRAAARVATAR